RPWSPPHRTPQRAHSVFFCYTRRAGRFKSGRRGPWRHTAAERPEPHAAQGRREARACPNAHVPHKLNIYPEVRGDCQPHYVAAFAQLDSFRFGGYNSTHHTAPGKKPLSPVASGGNRGTDGPETIAHGAAENRRKGCLRELDQLAVPRSSCSPSTRK